MTWLKQNWLVLILMCLMLVMIFTKVPQNTELKQYQIDELKTAMKETLLKEFDSLSKVVQIEIPLPNDSLQQVAIDLNKKIINEIRKNNLARIDTISTGELRDIFAGYRKEYDNSTH